MYKIKTRAQYVADDLRRRILGGEFTGGSQLRQDGLAADYEVSRIPVREALLTLEAEGLVEFHPHRGAFVTELSTGTIRELFDLRVMLEVKALTHAIPHLTPDDIAKAARVLTEYDQALNAGSEIDNWGEFNLAFHSALYAPSGMTETMALIGHLNNKCARYIRMQLLYTQEIQKTEEEHRHLLNLAASGDSDRACALLERHIRDACEGIIAVFESGLQVDSNGASVVS